MSSGGKQSPGLCLYTGRALSALDSRSQLWADTPRPSRPRPRATALCPLRGSLPRPGPSKPTCWGSFPTNLQTSCWVTQKALSQRRMWAGEEGADGGHRPPFVRSQPARPASSQPAWEGPAGCPSEDRSLQSAPFPRPSCL